MKPREVGISTCCIPSPDAALFDAMANAGVGCVELSLSANAYESFPWRDCAQWAANSGVRIRSFHLPFMIGDWVWVDPSSIDSAKRLSAREIHKRYAEIAASLGAKFIVVHASAEPIEDALRAAQLSFAIESMSLLTDTAYSFGMTVCVENLPRTCLGNKSDELAKIVNSDPRLRVCFDTNHLLGETHKAFVETVGDKIATLHVSDYDFVNERHWLPGEGAIDWKEIASLLDQIGYQDAFTYELSFAPNEKTVRRDRDLQPADLVRNAREIEARQKITVHGRGGITGLPMWP